MSQPDISFSAPAEPPPLYDRRPLPAGWVKEHDPQSDRDYYVDTLASPPRSIWVHPLDDPEFTRLHRGDDASLIDSSDDGHSTQTRPSRPPSSASASASGIPPDDKRSKSEFPDDKKSSSRRHDDDHLQVPSTSGASGSGSGSGSSSSSGSRPAGHSRTGSATSTSSTTADGKKRGFFGKLKDKAIGTKEEREAARKAREARRAEEERLYYERRDALMAQRVQQMEQERAAYERLAQAHPGQRGRQDYYYSRPAMNAYGGPTYQDPYNYGRSPYGYQQQPRYYQQQRSSGLGGGGALLGGLVGGLLLGDLLF